MRLKGPSPSYKIGNEEMQRAKLIEANDCCVTVMRGNCDNSVQQLCHQRGVEPQSGSSYSQIEDQISPQPPS
jgi:hypothetical protein